MSQPSVVHNTFVIERSYPKSPERVFQAFADPAKKRRWYAAGGNYDVQSFEMDFRVGGAELARYTFKDGTPFPGVELKHEGSFQNIIANQRIVLSTRMSFGGNIVSSSLVTFELLPNGEGTDLICTHQGAFFEGADGPQMREAGWRSLLDKLEKELAD